MREKQVKCDILWIIWIHYHCECPWSGFCTISNNFIKIKALTESRPINTINSKLIFSPVFVLLLIFFVFIIKYNLFMLLWVSNELDDLSENCSSLFEFCGNWSEFSLPNSPTNDFYEALFHYSVYFIISPASRTIKPFKNFFLKRLVIAKL